MDLIFIILLAGAFFCLFSFFIIIINLIKLRINCDSPHQEE
jgi:hypothetical protein